MSSINQADVSCTGDLKARITVPIPDSNDFGRCIPINGNVRARGDVEAARAVIHQLQATLVRQQAQSNQVIVTLKLKLFRSQQHIKSQHVKTEQQINEIMSRLLQLEERLKKDHETVSAKLKRKQEEISIQRDQIKVLSEQNSKLQNVIKEIYSQCGINGYYRNGVNSCYSNKLEENAEESVDMYTGSDIIEGYVDVVGKGELEKFNKQYLKIDSTNGPAERHINSCDFGSPNAVKGVNRAGLLHFGGLVKLYHSSEKLDDIGKFRERSRTISGYPGRANEHSEFRDGGKASSVSSSSCVSDEASSTQHCVRFKDVTDDDDETRPVSVKRRHANLKIASSMPMLATIQEDVGGKNKSKTRPHSMPSMGMIEIHYGSQELSDSNTAVVSPKFSSPQHSPSPPPSPSYTQNPQNNSESSTFKLLKTMFRRKVGKQKDKKRSASLSHKTDKEYGEALRRHFEKYDMS